MILILVATPKTNDAELHKKIGTNFNLNTNCLIPNWTPPPPSPLRSLSLACPPPPQLQPPVSYLLSISCPFTHFPSLSSIANHKWSIQKIDFFLDECKKSLISDLV